MSFLFDTTIIIDLQKKNKNTLAKLEQLRFLNPNLAKITFVTEFEFLYGLKEKNHIVAQESIQFLRFFQVLHGNEYTAGILADLKYKYQKKGITLSITDLLIASIAISYNMTLLTRDNDFMVIEELKKIIINNND